MEKLVHKDLSYKIIGLIFKVFNKLGYGYQEKYYQRALALELDREKIDYIQEKEIKLDYQNKTIGKYFLDFVIENKIVVELKVANIFYSQDIKQILSYLKASGLALGILIIITKSDIKYKRIINIRDY
ncbi:MAG: GxxExxY protein [Candidatus Nealsonbacteria bacterium CG_4_10_14_0_2_um_filter_38_17]|uniref:GxxExxY protein n=1 Tax=Candidatus Nealsonbacteria bacterium CG_4_10_14_0_2_um_filter_38_17 TaxID=1974680 RepID=A0A2M7UYV8_9BACT|nr:MAG: GxxExxY protein [Candidatus Nealsonbacteria bacterium CG_4_10_14_0_2_um_filter_38_17]